jgi:hypothetical protein
MMKWPHKNTISDYEFRERTHKLLESLGWQAHRLSDGSGYIHICPACKNDSGHGHAEDCELAFLYNESGYSQNDRVSTKIRIHIDRTGLWAEKNGIIASAKTIETDEGRTEYALTYHRGRMPAHDAKLFTEMYDLEKAMREFEPNLRKWRLVSGL